MRLLPLNLRSANKTPSRLASPSPDGDTLSRSTLRMCLDVDNDANDLHAHVQPDNISNPYTLEEGRALKRHKNLSAQSDADADVFLKTAHPMRHAYQILLVGLKCRDALKIIAADNSKKYKLSDTLKKTCQDYAHVAVLSPKANRYRDSGRGPTIAATILATMRLIGIMELPPASETSRCDVVLTCISKALTEWRCHIKTQMNKTLQLMPLAADKENGTTPPIDIASLTHNCIGSSSAKATAALYQRMAFIHLCAVELKETPTPIVADKKFWHIVDEKLALWRQAFPIKENLQLMFDKAYNDDKKTFSEPDSKIPITMMKDLESWLTTLDNGLEK
ncbi:hypothetical protein B0H10DRAFT_2213977 [Mycena sp. CBHHK59/15]|nr:hypothetical protein B0H10DRAFT_2213977 [Mycena sp. CBHHK59/15]